MSDSTSFRWSELSTGRAFAIHLALSLLVFTSLVATMVLFWFPGKLFFIDGGWQGLKIVALIDLVLGPALTLLLYKPKKPKLLLDMSLIASLQIVALLYGFYTTHQQRTVAVVYADRAFNTLSASTLAAANEELRALELQPRELHEINTDTRSGLPMLLTPEPVQGKFGAYLAELLNGYPEPHERSDQFKPISEHMQDLQLRNLTKEQVAIIDPQGLVDAKLEQRGLERDDIQLHRFKARYASGIAIFDARDMRIVDYVNIAFDAAEQSQPGDAVADSDEQ